MNYAMKIFLNKPVFQVSQRIKTHLTMSKFVLTGCLLVLLASFLNYPTAPENVKGHQRRDLVVIFPISEQVKLARMEKNISEKELANRVGLSKMNIERIERGQVVPSDEVLQKLTKELGVQLKPSNY